MIVVALLGVDVLVEKGRMGRMEGRWGVRAFIY